MLISIIIPYYQGDKFIKTLLNSLNKAINTIHFDIDFEIILTIDSMETNRDEIEQLVLGYFADFNNVIVRVLKNKENIGVAATRNRAIEISSGDYLHIIDQDDEIHHNFYITAINNVKTHNFILFNGIVNYANFYKPHLWFYLSPKLTLKKLLTNDFIRSPGQVFLAKNLSNNVFFPENTKNKGTDDRFFWLNIFIDKASILKPFYCKKPYYIAHIHNNNFSANKSEMAKSSLENCELLLKKNPSLKKSFRFYCHMQSQKLLNHSSLLWQHALIGGVTRILYFLDLNKLIRFLYKRR